MSEFVYKRFRKQEMELHFNPGGTVTDRERWTQERSKRSAAARAALKSWLNVRYGPRPRQVLDIFPAARPDAPVELFIHGGYWRSGSKDDYSFLASVLAPAGGLAVVIEYDLCPAVSVADIVEQARAAIAWTYGHIAEYGGDPAKIYLAGHSAGAHLAAMALACDWAALGLPKDLIKGAALISGVYDPEPVLHLSVNEDIRLAPDSARRNSPMLHPPLSSAPLIIAVGGDEPEGWRQMSREYFDLCRARGIDATYLEIPGAHHFSIPLLLADPTTALARALLGQMGL
ncbi:MAG TPA: alpha/beta hydrolase [Candidatus Acidoferrales bacterium]|nr:alpha/beta hydrolase [Candidatus Acidoferrales bacterium]